jgi:hypothetical protein
LVFGDFVFARNRISTRKKCHLRHAETVFGRFDQKTWLGLDKTHWHWLGLRGIIFAATAAGGVGLRNIDGFEFDNSLTKRVGLSGAPALVGETWVPLAALVSIDAANSYQSAGLDSCPNSAKAKFHAL